MMNNYKRCQIPDSEIMKRFSRMDDKDILKAIEDAEAWDMVVDEVEYLCYRYDIDMKDDDGEWKNGDTLVEEIKAKL